MPELPAGTANSSELYGVGKKTWGSNVNSARKVVRNPETGFKWMLGGTAGERLVSPADVRDKYAGVIFVGDSQIREVAWAAMKLLAPGWELRFSTRDPVFGGSSARKNQQLENTCVPQTVGKTGFTATCKGASCDVHSPFHNKSHAEAMRKLLLTRPHDWDGTLSLSDQACSSDFFLSYQATWGAIPVKPFTLPSCMHPRSADDTFGITRGAGGARKPVLWVMDGGGLHEMEYCDPRRWSLPQHVLRLFPDAVLRRSMVWQPVRRPPSTHPSSSGPHRSPPRATRVTPHSHSLAPQTTRAGRWRLHDALVEALQGRVRRHRRDDGRRQRAQPPRHHRRATLRLPGARAAVRPRRTHDAFSCMAARPPASHAWLHGHASHACTAALTAAAPLSVLAGTRR